MRTITLEEHYASPAFLDGPGREFKERARTAPVRTQGVNLAHIDEKLVDLGDQRIAEMDAAGIDMQVLSLASPGTEQLDPADAVAVAREVNDYLAAAVQRHPDRFAGFATLPTPDPPAAADELERLIGAGFKGAAINGHIGDRYLDDEFFWPILERAAAVHVPIYLHPATPTKPVVDALYRGNYSPAVADLFANAGWGWHIETAIHIIRIILSGAFDRFPGLQFIIGHLGEGLPFMINRLDRTLAADLTKLQRPVSAYLRENISYTFSGFNYLPTFLDTFLQVGVDRIMFSADYPFGSMAAARAFLDQLPISPADKERIAHTNAERLLQL